MNAFLFLSAYGFRDISHLFSAKLMQILAKKKKLTRRNFNDSDYPFRHERSSHPEFTSDSTTAAPTDETEQTNQDPVYNYHCARLALGLFMADINDAIKGDSTRLVDAYKLALLFFHHYGHPKYAYVVLLHLVQLKAFLPESEALDLEHNCFHNEHGGSGCNISFDLRKEQDHHTIKPMWKSLASNLSEENAARIAHSLEGLKGALHSVDRDCEVHSKKGYRSQKSPVETVEQIVKDLNRNSVFNLTKGRGCYPSFENFPVNLLSTLDYRELHSWMSEKIKLCASIYEPD